MNAPLPWHGPIVSLNAMKQLLLILALVALVGCGQPAITHEEVEKVGAETQETKRK